MKTGRAGESCCFDSSARSVSRGIATSDRRGQCTENRTPCVLRARWPGPRLWRSRPLQHLSRPTQSEDGPRKARKGLMRATPCRWYCGRPERPHRRLLSPRMVDAKAIWLGCAGGWRRSRVLIEYPAPGSLSRNCRGGRCLTNGARHPQFIAGAKGTRVHWCATNLAQKTATPGPQKGG